MNLPWTACRRGHWTRRMRGWCGGLSRRGSGPCDSRRVWIALNWPRGCGFARTQRPPRPGAPPPPPSRHWDQYSPQCFPPSHPTLLSPGLLGLPSHGVNIEIIKLQSKAIDAWPDQRKQGRGILQKNFIIIFGGRCLEQKSYNYMLAKFWPWTQVIHYLLSNSFHLVVSGRQRTVSPAAASRAQTPRRSAAPDSRRLSPADWTPSNKFYIHITQDWTPSNK